DDRGRFGRQRGRAGVVSRSEDLEGDFAGGREGAAEGHFVFDRRADDGVEGGAAAQGRRAFAHDRRLVRRPAGRFGRFVVAVPRLGGGPADRPRLGAREAWGGRFPRHDRGGFRRQRGDAPGVARAEDLEGDFAARREAAAESHFVVDRRADGGVGGGSAERGG